MEIVHLGSGRPVGKDMVIALGFFDGLHLGHQKLISRAVSTAAQLKVPSALLTFRRHPLEVIHHGLCFPYLSSMREKHCICRMLGLDYFIDLDFTKNLSRQTPEEFVRGTLLERLGGKVFVVGPDYRFGYRMTGGVEKLEELTAPGNAGVIVVPDLKKYGVKVSSTAIREAVMGGNLGFAADCLGRWYSLTGEVRHGKGRGRNLGIPTANLDLPHDRVMPRPGVFSVFVYLGGRIHKGVGHVGDKPTFNENTYNLEVHLFDFDGDIYGKEITTFFVRHMRDTLSFESPAQMMRQIEADLAGCRDFLGTISRREIRRKAPCFPRAKIG
jgi:riboflavin kinase/FMN adenylyltransferase